LYKSILAEGAMVDMSIKKDPFFILSRTPFFPLTISITCGESGSMVITTSAFAASSPGVAKLMAPSATNSFAAALVFRIKTL